MNIFVLSNSIEECARNHCDKHVVKMPTEIMQMMGTVYRNLHGTKQTVYVKVRTKNNKLTLKKKEIPIVSTDKIVHKMGIPLLVHKELPFPTHANHPCTLWLASSIDNWRWLKQLAILLEAEWRYRYNHPYSKDHKSVNIIRKMPTPSLPKIGITPFVQCMPAYLRSNDAIQSYRKFYIAEKSHLASWKKRQKPKWYTLENKVVDQKNKNAV